MFIEPPVPATPPPMAPAAAAETGDDAGATAQRQLVLAAARARHWQRCSRLTGALLLAWLATTFGSAFFARELAGLTVFGWPLSFYLAAQGAALIYLAILAIYALSMRAIDREFHRRTDGSAAGVPTSPSTATLASAPATTGSTA